MEKIKLFIKNEIVLVISCVLAVISAFFVKPTSEYINYIDFRTLSLLFCLMVVMAGLKKLGVFKLLAEKLLIMAKDTRQIYIIFVALAFFSSMIITNDVALITFVPFTLITLNLANKKKHIIYIITMETVAANLGSMLTPIGNPQNLFLFSNYNMTTSCFFKTILPYSVLSFVLLIIGTLFIKKDSVSINQIKEKTKISRKYLSLYLILFLLCVLSVFRVIDFKILIIVVVVAIIIFDKKGFLDVDYSLIFTFVFLFIFIGNLGNIDIVSDFLRKSVEKREVIVGVLSSQVISNVPAAVLLSKFTKNATGLLIGVNIGGLGTLIASMASLISFKFIQKEEVGLLKYFCVFTGVNVLFLALNLFLYYLM